MFPAVSRCLLALFSVLLVDFSFSQFLHHPTPLHPDYFYANVDELRDPYFKKWGGMYSPPWLGRSFALHVMWVNWVITANGLRAAVSEWLAHQPWSPSLSHCSWIPSCVRHLSPIDYCCWCCYVVLTTHPSISWCDAVAVLKGGQAGHSSPFAPPVPPPL